MDHELEGLARLSQLEEQLAVLRHDLRNRLGSIRNGTYYLKRKIEKTELWETDERFPRFFGLIDQEIANGEELLSSQASVETILPRALEPQLLEVGVARGIQQVRVPAFVTLEVDYAQEKATPVWSVEIALLTRCLVENAVEAVEASERRTIRVETRSRDDRAWLSVEDTGPGIPEDAIAAALQPFRSEKPQHRGIGLNIARRIVQRYRGGLAFREPRGGGLRVDVDLP